MPDQGIYSNIQKRGGFHNVRKWHLIQPTGVGIGKEDLLVQNIFHYPVLL